MKRKYQFSVDNATTVARMENSDVDSVGRVSLTAAESSATSSVDRLTRSPVPASSTRWVGSPSAVPIMSWRRLAMTRSDSRATR